MANYTFKRRIHRLTGIAENDVSSDWLTDSAREVIAILPEDRASAAAEEVILPVHMQELTLGANIMEFTSLAVYPHNLVSEVFKSVEGKIDRISTMVGGEAQEELFVTWNGTSWVGNFQVIEVGLSYTVIVNQNVTFYAQRIDMRLAGGTLVDNINIDKSRLLNVLRYDGTHWLPCRQIDSIMKGKAETDSGYMEESTSTDPVYYLENNKLVALPTPTETYQLKLSRVVYPSIGRDEYNLPRFPDEFEHIVTLGACLKAKQYLIARAHEEEDLELATSHSNHLNLLRQDYQTALQIVTAGLTQGQIEKVKE